MGRFGWVAADAWLATRAGSAALARRQQSRLRSIVAFAVEHSAVYAERYAGLARLSFRDLPPVTKPSLMADFERWVTDPAVRWADVDRFAHDPTTVGQRFRGRYTVFTTSGSTGEPAVLLHDQAELAVIAALSLVRGTLAWNSPTAVLASAWRLGGGRERHAALFATGSHLPAVTVAERRRRGGRGRQLRVFSILTPPSELVAALNAFQPTRIDSYPSALAMLAEEQHAGRLVIRPTLLTAVGETLTLPVRLEIQAAFGARLFQHYSTAETGTLAFDCGSQRLHLNSDWFVLEPVDQALEPMPPDHASHGILVTSLANRIQPLIRYHIGDSVVLHSEPCACGSPLPVLSVEGPADETLELETPSGHSRLLPLAVYGQLKQIGELQRYQLIQAAPDLLRLRLQMREGLDETGSDSAWQAAEQAIRDLVGVPDVRIERAAEPPAADARSGKYRFQWAALDQTGASEVNPRRLS